MEKTLLSIVIPCYNAQEYIQLCIDNLENQTFSEWEAIFVNDGSTDGTGWQLDRLLSGKDKYKVIHKENGGTASARNKGIEAASGRYITFLDADDELASDMYEKMVSLMEDTGVDLGVCGFYFKVEQIKKGKVQTTYLEEKKYPSVHYRTPEQIREHLVDMWDSDILSNVWNKMYKLSLIREKDLYYRNGHVYTEDRVFNRQFIENCGSLAVTEQCLYYYVRERTGSTTEKYRDDYFLIRYKEYHEFQDHFKKLGIWDDKAREYTCREFTERISGCLENIFHAEKQLSAKEKYMRIGDIIRHEDVREAVSYARCRSRKMRLLVFPIKMRNTLLAYLMYGMVYHIRRSDPALFHKLKSRR
ncbi:MAG: glycosyltransferase family 2 protein [Butyrivibrio sp.]|nr:glycosyltransferase family 2 protein [Butyrivibrio sp.]